MRRRELLAFGLVVGTAPTALAAPAAGPPPARVVLAVDGTEQTRNLPVLVAERLGYFKDAGLVVTLVDSPATPSPAELMADGRADGAVAFYHHTFMSQADDHVVTQAVVTLGVTPALKLLVATRLRGQVKTVADLKGLRIYAGGANSGKTTAANWLITHAGYGLKDYTRLANVERGEMAEALRTGTADAIVSHQPDADYYEASGIGFVLADLSTAEGVRQNLGSVFPSTSLYLPKAYVEANPQVVQRLVNACLRALAFLGHHSAQEIAAVLPPRMVGKDKAAFLKLLAEDKLMFATDGRMAPEAARAEWAVMTALTPKYGSIRFEETFTNAFVDRAPPELRATARSRLEPDRLA